MKGNKTQTASSTGKGKGSKKQRGITPSHRTLTQLIDWYGADAVYEGSSIAGRYEDLTDGGTRILKVVR